MSLSAVLMTGSANPDTVAFNGPGGPIHDNDRLVDGTFDSWGLILSGVPVCPGDIAGDANRDGVVDLADLNLLLANFGGDCAN